MTHLTQTHVQELVDLRTEARLHGESELDAARAIAAQVGMGAACAPSGQASLRACPADAERIVEALEDLVGEAFGEAGSCPSSVRVERTRQDDGNDLVVLQVVEPLGQ